jgi:hypothetical protein
VTRARDIIRTIPAEDFILAAFCALAFYAIAAGVAAL